MVGMTAAEKELMLQIAAHYVGYQEKRTSAIECYEDFVANAGRGNFTRFGRLADIVIFGEDKRNKDGFAWCAQFLLSCLYEVKAGRQCCNVQRGAMAVNAEARRWVADVVNDGKPLTYFAGCAAWRAAYNNRGKASRNNPHRGDFVVFLRDSIYNGDNGIAYHIGIIERVEAGFIMTIEGNTSGASAQIVANGGEVARKRRRITDKMLFLEN